MSHQVTTKKCDRVLRCNIYCAPCEALSQQLGYGEKLRSRNFAVWYRKLIMPQLHHVCSHLQNASKARQGITSIPVTRLNLRLALALKSAGFLSTVQPGDYGGPDRDGAVVPITPENLSSRR